MKGGEKVEIKATGISNINKNTFETIKAISDDGFNDLISLMLINVQNESGNDNGKNLAALESLIPLDGQFNKVEKLGHDNFQDDDAMSYSVLKTNDFTQEIDKSEGENDKLSTAVASLNSSLPLQLSFQESKYPVHNHRELLKENKALSSELEKLRNKTTAEKLTSYGVQLVSGGVVAENILNIKNKINDLQKENNEDGVQFRGINIAESNQEVNSAVLSCDEFKRNYAQTEGSQGDVIYQGSSILKAEHGVKFDTDIDGKLKIDIIQNKSSEIAAQNSVTSFSEVKQGVIKKASNKLDFRNEVLVNNKVNMETDSTEFKQVKAEKTDAAFDVQMKQTPKNEVSIKNFQNTADEINCVNAADSRSTAQENGLNVRGIKDNENNAEYNIHDDIKILSFKSPKNFDIEKIILNNNGNQFINMFHQYRGYYQNDDDKIVIKNNNHDEEQKINTLPEHEMHGVLNLENDSLDGTGLKSAKEENKFSTILNNRDLIELAASKFKAIKLPDITELRVKIWPEELGEIIIKVSLEKGHVNGSIMSNNQEVVNILQANLDSLRQELKNSNINLYSLSVNISSSNDYSGDFRGQNSGSYSGSRRNKSYIPEYSNNPMDDYIDEINGEGLNIIA